MKSYFCWRCGADMPFLDELEWSQMSPLLTNAIQEVKNYREAHGCDIATARKSIKPEATELFEKLTGCKNVDFNVIYHHRLADLGPECNNCGHLLRRASSSFCANCGKPNTAARQKLASVQILRKWLYNCQTVLSKLAQRKFLF